MSDYTPTKTRAEVADAIGMAWEELHQAYDHLSDIFFDSPNESRLKLLDDMLDMLTDVETWRREIEAETELGWEG